MATDVLTESNILQSICLKFYLNPIKSRMWGSTISQKVLFPSHEYIICNRELMEARFFDKNSPYRDVLMWQIEGTREECNHHLISIAQDFLMWLILSKLLLQLQQLKQTPCCEQKKLFDLVRNWYLTDIWFLVRVGYHLLEQKLNNDTLRRAKNLIPRTLDFLIWLFVYTNLL